jgi:hypothetical protein
MISLLNETTLTFSRQVEKNILGEDGYFERLPDEEFDAIGSLQPYRMGASSIKLPEGVSSSSAFKFFTKTKLNTVDAFNKLSADVTTIDGKPYEVFHLADWSYAKTLTPYHYLAILIMRDTDSGRWDR